MRNIPYSIIALLLIIIHDKYQNFKSPSLCKLNKCLLVSLSYQVYSQFSLRKDSFFKQVGNKQLGS